MSTFKILSKKLNQAIAGFAVVAGCLLPGATQAVTIRPLPPVTIQETFDPSQGQGEYTVSNQSGSGIYAFFVGNNLATGVGKSEQALPSWTGAVISRSDWENGNISWFGFRDLARIGPGGWTPPDTTQLSWDSIFGSDYTKAAGYWSDGFGEIIPEAIANGETRGGFLFYSQVPASPFVAFDSSGGIVGQGATSVVPLPPAVLLFGSALAGFVGLRKRQR